MGDWLHWLILIGILMLIACVYLLSLQLERSVHLAVSILAGNQHRILERLDQLAAARSGSDVQVVRAGSNVLPFDRRVAQRRRPDAFAAGGAGNERRRSPGRRREDLALASR